MEGREGREVGVGPCKEKEGEEDRRGEGRARAGRRRKEGGGRKERRDIKEEGESMWEGWKVGGERERRRERRE